MSLVSCFATVFVAKNTSEIKLSQFIYFECYKLQMNGIEMLTKLIWLLFRCKILFSSCNSLFKYSRLIFVIQKSKLCKHFHLVTNNLNRYKKLRDRKYFKLAYQMYITGCFRHWTKDILNDIDCIYKKIKKATIHVCINYTPKMSSRFIIHYLFQFVVKHGLILIILI